MVRAGYDAVSHTYRGDVENGDCALYHEWLDELIPLLQPATRVLDLGCGCGIPVARRLAQSHQVTGVDLSAVQIRRALELVPAARFLCADMMTLEFPPSHFAAIASFYAIIHVPLDQQPALFRNMADWLQPGGYLMATVGHDHWTGTEEDWLGVEGATMYWSHADSATYEAWLTLSGLEVLWTRFVPEGDSGHTLLLARKLGVDAL
jgi:SAM-dependent methyltransferase